MKSVLTSLTFGVTLIGCATEPSATAEASATQTLPPTLAVTQDDAEECASQILAFGTLSKGRSADMFARSQTAYVNAASWVTYYRAKDPVRGIHTVLDKQTREAQARARHHIGEWQEAAENGTSIETSMQPAITCVARYTLVGTPPGLPGTAP